MFKKEISPNWFLISGIAGFLFLFVVTLSHKQPPVFDEPFFVANVHLYEKQGLSEEFLVSLKDQAPGPLYEWVHIAFKPLTGLRPPGIRLVNVFMLAIVIVLMTRIIAMTRRVTPYHSFIYALCIIGVPMVWQISGLALTEMPAITFCLISLFFLIHAITREHRPVLSVFLAILAGLMLGVAILGRSPFLLVAVFSVLLLVNDLKSGKRWRTILLYSISAFSVSLPVFLIWNGLVPPQQAFVGNGISPWHGILAFAYGAFLTLIIAPKWFYFNRRILFCLVAGYVIFLLINFYALNFQYFPLGITLQRMLPAAFMRVYPLLISPLLAVLAIYFFVCCIIQGWKKREDPVFIFILACGMVMLASSCKVTHLFSTRYVAQAAPFFVLLSPGYDKYTVSKLLRLLAGMAIGFMSMETYFNFH